MKKQISNTGYFSLTLYFMHKLTGVENKVYDISPWGPKGCIQFARNTVYIFSFYIFPNITLKNTSFLIYCEYPWRFTGVTLVKKLTNSDNSSLRKDRHILNSKHHVAYCITDDLVFSMYKWLCSDGQWEMSRIILSNQA